MDQQTILTIASIVTSAVAALAAVASALISRKVYKSQTTPEVIAYVVPAPDAEVYAMLVVENIGKAPAYDVSYAIEGAAISELSKSDKELGEFLSTSVPFLQPGGIRRTPLGMFLELDPEWGDGICWLTVCYLTKRNRKSTEVRSRFPIEVYSLRGYGSVSRIDPMLREMGRVASELKRTANALERRNPS